MSPMVIVPMSASTQAVTQPPMIWLVTGAVQVVRPPVPVAREASLDQMLDYLNRKDLIDFRHSIDVKVKDLR